MKAKEFQYEAEKKENLSKIEDLERMKQGINKKAHFWMLFLMLWFCSSSSSSLSFRCALGEVVAESVTSRRK